MKEINIKYKFLITKCAICLATCFVFANLANAQTTEAELKRRKARTEQEIANLNKQINQTTSAKQTTEEKITLLNKRIAQRKELIRTTDIQISLTKEQISVKNAEIRKQQQQLQQLKDYFSDLVVNVYTKRKKSTFLMYVFASEDLGQAFRRIKYLQSYTDVVSKQADKIKNLSAKIKNEVVALDKTKNELVSFQKSKQTEIEKIAKDESSAQQMLVSLKGNEGKLRKQIEQKRKQLASINAQIENLLKKEVAKNTKSGYTKTPQSIKLSGDFASNRGRLPWPVKQGRISASFGEHNHPIFKYIKLPPNNGVDIATPANESVQAVFGGTVCRVFSLPGMFVCVMIQHGEYYSVYCRLTSVSAKAGQSVKAGETIGSVVGDGENTHIHFELWKGMSKMNPELWLKKK